MEQDRENNAGEVGVIDIAPNYKAKILAIYPHAYCLQHQRRTFHIRNADGKFENVVRYQYEIVINDKGNRIATSKYTEDGAWEYAWKFVENKMLDILES